MKTMIHISVMAIILLSFALSIGQAQRELVFDADGSLPFYFDHDPAGYDADSLSYEIYLKELASGTVTLLGTWNGYPPPGTDGEGAYPLVFPVDQLHYDVGVQTVGIRYGVELRSVLVWANWDMFSYNPPPLSCTGLRR